MTYNTVESIVDKKEDKTKNIYIYTKTEMKQFERLRDHFPKILLREEYVTVSTILDIYCGMFRLSVPF